MRLRRLSPAAQVWFFRGRALVWVAVGAWSFLAGQADSVTLVWIASLYANVATDLGGAAAADDRRVLDELAAIRHRLDALGGDDR